MGCGVSSEIPTSANSANSTAGIPLPPPSLSLGHKQNEETPTTATTAPHHSTNSRLCSSPPLAMASFPVVQHSLSNTTTPCGSPLPNSLPPTSPGSIGGESRSLVASQATTPPIPTTAESKYIARFRNSIPSMWGSQEDSDAQPQPSSSVLSASSPAAATATLTQVDSSSSQPLPCPPHPHHPHPHSSGCQGGGGSGVTSTCHDSISSGSHTSPVSESSYRSHRRRSKRPTCEGRRLVTQFRSVLEEVPNPTPISSSSVTASQSSPPGKLITQTSGDQTHRSRDSSGMDGGGGGCAGGSAGGNTTLNIKGSFSTSCANTTTEASSPSGPLPPSDYYAQDCCSPHSPFFTGNVQNGNQRAPKGWEPVNVVARSVASEQPVSSLDTSGILGASMRGGFQPNSRAATTQPSGSKALPSVDQSSPNTMVLCMSSATIPTGSVPLPLDFSKVDDTPANILRNTTTPAVVTPVPNRGAKRGVRCTRVGAGGRLSATLQSSSSSGSIESLLLSDTDLQHAVDEVFGEGVDPPTSNILIPSPRGAAASTSSQPRANIVSSSVSSGAVMQQHQIPHMSVSNSDPRSVMGGSNSTTGNLPNVFEFGSKSETQYLPISSSSTHPSGLQAHSGSRRNSMPLVVSPGLPPVAPPPVYHFAMRGGSVDFRSSTSTDHNHHVGGVFNSSTTTTTAKRMSTSSGATTVNNHSIALTDISLGGGGAGGRFGMSSSSSVSHVKDHPLI